MMTAMTGMETLREVTSASELMRIVGRYFRDAGFEHWMYALDLPVAGDQRRQYVLSGYPTDWVSHYFDSGYLQVDPVIAHCQTHTRPWLWPMDRGSHARLSKAARRMFDEAGEFGLYSGVSIPLHGLGCSWGLVSVATERRIDAAEMNEILAGIHLFAHCLHEAGHVYAQGAPPADAAHVTERELECLRWVAAGKTSWEIGKLMNISERTAVFHIQNAMRKLQAPSRHAAVVRAISSGLIQP